MMNSALSQSRAQSSRESPPTSDVDLTSVVCRWNRAREQLLQQKTADHHWVGQLSTSALSTATAISALAVSRRAQSKEYLTRRAEIDQAIEVASHWLMDHQNADGGFGDTDRSHSNIATTLLVLAAWQLSGFNQKAGDKPSRAWKYCESLGTWDALRKRYGKDKTFVAPILTNCALAGIVDWQQVPTLPFEAAWLPQSWYRWARMPVVSYAVPALVAIGQAKFYHCPPKGIVGAVVGGVRKGAIEPTLRVLQRMQPASGGYLEAVPLTSFVLMCLADMQLGDHPVAVSAVRFLLDSRLSDGSLPIDTNLATWTTSLSISALHYGHSHRTSREHALPDSATNQAGNRISVRAETVGHEATDITTNTIRWLLSCQHWSEHPFTGARPGGWGWSNLSGAVPDADDTPAALLALAHWTECWQSAHTHCYLLPKQIAHAVQQGMCWLMDLQNRDGGWPTFCRGWGKLPFDRSGSDLTAHALRAIEAWRQLERSGKIEFPPAMAHRFRIACERGFRFLAKRQNSDGSWFPLWFGNQDRPDEENPVYGTAKVLMAYAAHARWDGECLRAIDWLVEHQNCDGGWGGGPSIPYLPISLTQPTEQITAKVARAGSSVEETGWTLEALQALVSAGCSTPRLKPTIMRGLEWMMAAVDQDLLRVSWPIGFYFAKLWYHERLYPMIAATAALGSAAECSELWSENEAR